MFDHWDINSEDGSPSQFSPSPKTIITIVKKYYKKINKKYYNNDKHSYLNNKLHNVTILNLKHVYLSLRYHDYDY